MSKTKLKKGLNRRNFIAATGALGLSGLCPVSLLAAGQENYEGNSQILKAGPYIQSSVEIEMTIRWVTNMPCQSWVEYGEQAGELGNKAEVVENGLAGGCQTVNAITLEGLSPNKKYYYRICSKAIEKFDPYNVVFGDTYESPVYSFKTFGKDAENVSFIVFNDVHDRPGSFKQLLKLQNNKEKDFMLLNGDIFNYMTGEDQIVRNLLEPISGISPSVPLVFARGNHETRGGFARNLPSYFNCGKNGYYYSFVAGPVYCAVLDSGEDKPDNDKEYFGLVKFDPYRLAQREWLEKETRKKEFKDAKYRLVFCHIPPYYSGDWHGTIHCRDVWGDIFNKAKIDLLIAGHTHVYGIHPAVKGQHAYPIAIGGGSKDGTRAIIEVSATDDSLKLKITADDGQLKGELNIESKS